MEAELLRRLGDEPPGSLQWVSGCSNWTTPGMCRTTNQAVPCSAASQLHSPCLPLH